MADLTRLGTPAGSQIAAVTETKPHMRFYRCGVAFAQGQAGYIDTDGLVKLADVDVAASVGKFVGIALAPISAGEAGTFLWDGSVAGFDLTSLAYGAQVYMSVTAGELADTDGAVGGPVGRVLPLSDKDLTKVLYIKADMVLGNV